MNSQVSQSGVTILVGTTKGAFLVSGGSNRQGWKLTGPFCNGWPINHVIGDPVTGLLWAGGGGEWHGAGVWRSEDFGSPGKLQSSQRDRSTTGRPANRNSQRR